MPAVQEPTGSLGLFGVGGDLHLDDLVGIADRAVARRIALLDLVDELHPRSHLAPRRVLAVERGGRREHDEELAVGAVRALGARHADDAADEMLAGEFSL